TASPRLAGLPRAALFDAHHLDQRGPEPKLERGVFSPLPLSVGAARVVPAYSEASLGVLPATADRCGAGRYAAAQNRPFDSTSVLSAGSVVAAISHQSRVGPALLAGLAAGALASQRPGRLTCLAHSFSGSVSRQASRQESQQTDAATVSGSGQTEESVAQLCPDEPATAARTGRCRRA